MSGKGGLGHQGLVLEYASQMETDSSRGSNLSKGNDNFFDKLSLKF